MYELDLQQKQGLFLTPVLAQSLHLLTLPLLELAEYVQAQVEENPALELGSDQEAEEGNDPAAGDLRYGVTVQDQAVYPEAAYNETVYDEAAYAETAYEENRRNYLLAAGAGADFFGNAALAWTQGSVNPPLAARQEQDLPSMLRLQLALREAPRELRQAARQIIEHLDGDGYFTLPLTRLSELCGHEEALLQQALSLVQSLEPAGVAARDLRECLRLQIGAAELQRQLILAVIERHLSDVAKNRVQETARALKVSAEQVKRAFTRIRALHPQPAAGLCGVRTETPYIVPDIIVHQVAGEYHISLNENLEPRLHISAYYRHPHTRLDEEARKYMQEKMAAAMTLIRNMEKRRETIQRLAQITLERQRGFLADGLAGLIPLTMKEVAAAAAIHESTVSRAIAGKYIQTPRGMYAWKFFFPRAYGRVGDMKTPAWIKAQLSELIAREDKAHPYSDRRLQELLAGRGLIIARRTVTKYRENLGIGARAMRRR